MKKKYFIMILFGMFSPVYTSDKAGKKPSATQPTPAKASTQPAMTKTSPQQKTAATSITVATARSKTPPKRIPSPIQTLSLRPTTPPAREKARSKTPPVLEMTKPQPACSILEIASRGVNPETGLHDTYENIRTWSSARLAIQKGNPDAAALVAECIQLGIAGTADFTETAEGVVDHDLLTAAARCGNSEILHSLLQAKIDLNTPSPDGATAIFAATVREQYSCVQILLGAKASPHYPYKKVTALSLLQEQMYRCRRFGPLPEDDLIEALKLAHEHPQPERSIMKPSRKSQLVQTARAAARTGASAAMQFAHAAGITVAGLAQQGFQRVRRKGKQVHNLELSVIGHQIKTTDEDGYEIVQRTVTTATETVIRSTQKSESQGDHSSGNPSAEDAD